MRNSRKAELTNKKELQRLIELPMTCFVYRQTKNWKLNRWNCSQCYINEAEMVKLKAKIHWRRIKNVDRVLDRVGGYAFAIWRMREVILQQKDRLGRPRYSAEIKKIISPPYSRYYLLVYPIKYDISGIF